MKAFINVDAYEEAQEELAAERRARKRLRWDRPVRAVYGMCRRSPESLIDLMDQVEDRNA